MASKMEDHDIEQCVQTMIEIGHSSSRTDKAAKEGFTHEWTVFVRGQEGCDISHFVEKVVFYLEPTFSNPRRVVRVAPYCVSEMGDDGFYMPVEIFFKNKKEPRMVFSYHLFLPMYTPITNVRSEKLTFKRATDEFKEKLIKAGNVCMNARNKLTFN